MKRKPKPLLKKAGVCAGTVAVSAALLTGCNWFRPDQNEPVCVYGPPEYFEDDYDSSEEMPETVYGPPEYFWEQGES